MHPELRKLYKIGEKDQRTIIGLMSGTSLDGLDIALCEVRGTGRHTEIELRQFHTEPYDETYRDNVHAVFSKRQVDLQHLCALNPWIAQQHGAMILSALDRWGVSPDEVDLIASHGQTVYHCPRALHQNQDFPNATLQLGDGDHLARTTGIITLSDFRQKHIAAGGEGAPLAAYGDYLIFSAEDENRIMLNIGGIANITFLPRSGSSGKFVCTDVGPGNTMMDAYVRRYFSPLKYDEDSRIGRSGAVSDLLLAELKDNPFFDLKFPKTTGPELFNLDYLYRAQERCGAEGLPQADIVATLSKFSADGIVRAINSIADTDGEAVIYVSGGGFHNPLLLGHIGAGLPGYRVESTQALKIDPDAKEAVLFALLANECVAGDGVNEELNFLGMPNTAMGKISFAH